MPIALGRSEPNIVPPSATYFQDFIDTSTEHGLIDVIDALSWRADLRRRVQHYGYRYDYKARRVTEDSYLGPLPDWLDLLATRLLNERIFGTVPDQVIVNEYLPGQGIAAHVDCEPCFGDVIASLSLGATCVMDFAHLQSGERVSHPLQPGSLLVLEGESRFHWQHGIAARKSDTLDGSVVQRGRRVSLTFRTVVSTG